jgi:hypothetical protein
MKDQIIKALENHVSLCETLNSEGKAIDSHEIEFMRTEAFDLLDIIVGAEWKLK